MQSVLIQQRNNIVLIIDFAYFPGTFVIIVRFQMCHIQLSYLSVKSIL